jgi:aryl-phospho-beta-D-glucosidase BglC (GH1 family)
MKKMLRMQKSCGIVARVVNAALSFILIISSTAGATTFYVDASNGNDRNDGLSPETAWKTIAKMNGTVLRPGDPVLFKRGEVWREKLVIKNDRAESTIRRKPVIKIEGELKTEANRAAGDTTRPRPPTNVRVVAVEVNPADFVRRRGNELVVGGNVQPLYLRGVNFAGYFMIAEDGEWYTEGVERRFPSPDSDVPVALHEVWKNWFKERHFAVVAETGFNVIRVPLTYRIFEDNSAPGRYKQEGWDFLDKYIAWAKQYKVYLLLDMHIAQGGYQPSEAGKKLWNDSNLQLRYRSLWKAIAGRYANETIIAGYDLLNEPHPASSATDGDGDNKQWKTLAQQVIDDIRSVDRNHLIVVEAVNWIDDGTISDWSPEVLENFQFMVNDDNVMYDFHFYFPFDYVFADDPDRYPSSKKVPTIEGRMATFDKQYLEAELQSIQRFAASNPVPMNFGEWSGPAIDKSGGLEYAGDLISLFDQHGINWNFWSILDFYTNDDELKDQHLIQERLNIFKTYFASSRSQQ